MSPLHLTFYCLVFMLAAFTQGVTGFGSALVAVPLLSLFMDIRTVVPLSILYGLIVTLFLTYRMRRHVDRKRLLPLIIGCLPGIAVGCSLLK
ncbi:MAG: sulfite exporter TauE/SafE family protein, partial [Deltaproteobacteria bacterium]